ncbi:NAD(P)H-quinone oxidoreductase subunit 5 [Noviherbaspirillum humi]|uniref:Probable inorganic carbon transporter subunit DabB n=1 Tax=Noviherbaspirillum humi TaxID=1688639 RepID=A0A239KCU9_9BURK|nr:NADH-quinone oxidoreductase subunit L [Noviherbaspirillum humi]SNT15800.1 NAD(P)H-quinone oxidoreductase subunit 5 [Noviherbaspirillum humi]
MAPFTFDTLAWCVPATYLAASGWAALDRRLDETWRVAAVASLISLAVALAAGAGAAWQAASAGIRADGLGLAMTLLIALLGWVILRYSRRYLAGEPGQGRYLKAMLLTLASVATVALTDHLGVLVLAWAMSSLGLHALLTFYADRPAALIVAHKKFLASRLAELCLAGALALVYRDTGSLYLDDIAAHLQGMSTLPPGLAIAAALVALAVIFKSAQLPVHGWLIQVMEAPTPVSALLHAGVVNLGGLVLIRLAPLMTAATPAREMLIAVGSLSAVLAGLVMMTRISIKVRLAWSTCAQMGFMLMECGLGLYDLAFLHLMAHSLYKAHAFLSAGDTVSEVRRRDLLPAFVQRKPLPALVQKLAAAPIAVGAVAASAAAWSLLMPHLHLSAAAVLVAGLGLAPLLWHGMLAGAVRLLALAQLYIAWHLVFSVMVGTPAAPASTPVLAWIGACFVLLYLTQAWLQAFPRGRLAARLYPWAYAGFYLDERFTRLTFRLWPARMPAHVVGASALPRPAAQGENA